MELNQPVKAKIVAPVLGIMVLIVGLVIYFMAYSLMNNLESYQYQTSQIYDVNQ